MDELSAQVETACTVLRAVVLKIQSTLFKGMVTIARKWLDDKGLDPTDRRSKYLIQLLMLAAVRSTDIRIVPPPRASKINV